jgi:ABC-type glycerol-3-phosphate transport system substrate-binding protein
LKRCLAFTSVAVLLLTSWADRVPAAASQPLLQASFLGGWSGPEKTNFLAILSYCKSHYNVDTTYDVATGDPAIELNTRVRAGNPPDLATLSTPSAIKSFAPRGFPVPLTFLDMPTIRKQYAPYWRTLGTINGKLYAIYMKADVKSIIWYSPKKLRAGHYTIPKTWGQMVALSQKMVRDGKHPWAFGVGDSSWTLADFFDNVYLMVAGPKKYDGLIAHTVKWTDPSVKTTFQTVNQIVSRSAMIAGGRRRALSQDWIGATRQMVTDPAAEFYAEATFLGAALRASLPRDVEGVDYSTFAFPRIGNWPATPVTVGPNAVAMFRDTPGSRALIRCLVDPNALARWAKRGGFISPNNATPMSAYPDSSTRAIARLMIMAGKAGLLRAGADDLMPPRVGGSPGGCMPSELTEWFRNPSGYPERMRAIELCATRVYGY